MSVEQFNQESLNYQRIEKAIEYIEENFTSQPSLDEIAASINLSKYHFDRLFKDWAGISPIQFMQFLTLKYTKTKLKESASSLDAALDAGLSGTGRLHDLFVTFEAMTPGEFKNNAQGLVISYTFGSTPFGDGLIATTHRGICHLAFIEPGDKDGALDELHKKWAGAVFLEDEDTLKPRIKDLFAAPGATSPKPFHLCLKGTNFQINVWKALLTIPRGNLVSYKDIAELLGQPKAYRAAASAIAKNPIAYLIPCHRVISSSGKINQYRWGSNRKRAILGWEAARITLEQKSFATIE